ncbi:uncharacterized protein G2W53_028687 [Senna tora]|uniref:Uncharacterized protein n=1 Tax=Senna tora TaxID=362788 RepID=A0A834T1E9_9FABA|nr:uncharacterized protein G2W53_028687 [Senna tora]
MATGQISWHRRLVASDISVSSSHCSRSCRRKRFNGRFSLSLLLNLSNTLIGGKNSHHRRKIHGHRTDLSALSSCSIRSLGAVVSLHQISRRRRLVAANLAGKNAEVLRESEGEEVSAAAEEEVFGLEVSDENLLLYSV